MNQWSPIYLFSDLKNTSKYNSITTKQIFLKYSKVLWKHFNLRGVNAWSLKDKDYCMWYCKV